MCKEFARTSVTALYLVTYQNSTCLITYPAQSLDKFRSNQSDSPYTLNVFYYATRHITFAQLSFPCVKVIDRQKCHMVIIIDRSNNLGIVCRLHSKARTTVKCLFNSQNTFPACMETRQFHSVFIGFSARID